MKEYRKKLKTQNILFIIGAVALIAVQILAHSGVVTPDTASAAYSDFWRGFIGGVAIGLVGILIIGVIINLLAMRNDEKLKKLFNKENDEREKLIAAKGKSAAASAFSFCLIIGGIVAGFFSRTVFATMLVCAVALSVFMCVGKLYYCKKL